MKLKIIYIVIILFFALKINADTIKNNFKAKFTAHILNDAPVKLIPFPKDVKWKHESIEINNISIDGNDISPLLKKELLKICNQNKIQINPISRYKILFSLDKNHSKEAYALHVTSKNIKITYSENSGAYYALQTLRQLIKTKNNKAEIPLCKINDKPKFAIRGFMIDVGRNFQSIDLLKKQLDLMAKYKLNTFHWHLTDRPAWRIESKKYPELTAFENHRPSRNPGKYYTYDEIREFIKYANEHFIQVIPEIDMPGHSDSFRKAMKCRMESKKGMVILENVLNEFFREIPKELAPIIHIGSDEVHIPNTKEFISKMVSIVEADGRKAIVWAPGLKAGKNVIKQLWRNHNDSISGYDEIDSGYSYINNGEPMSFINQLFFKPVGLGSSNNVLGGIMCLWPDVNVWNEKDIYRQHPVYPALLTYAWATWTADVISAPILYQTNLPANDIDALEYFSAFEKYLLEHKNRYFKNLLFPYFYQSDKKWQVIGPFNNNEADNIVKNDSSFVYYKGKKIMWKTTFGNSLTIKNRLEGRGLFPKAKPGQTVYARRTIFCENDTIINAWINFESPLRANRAYTGIAANGSWDINGGKIWINNELIKGPKWKNPLWHPFKTKGWAFGIDSETPWTDEELYWLREPAKIHLKKGWNKILVKIPCTAKNQNWMFTFVEIR